jgi:hypothetical protein
MNGETESKEDFNILSASILVTKSIHKTGRA